MKFRSFISTSLIACAALMATLLPTTASAKQCIWNKGGYVMNVSWFRPITLVTATEQFPKGGWRQTLRNVAPPVVQQSLVAGMGSCNDTNEELVAFISVAGCLLIKDHGSCRKGSVLLHPSVKVADLTQAAGTIASIGCHVDVLGWCYLHEFSMTPSLPDQPVMAVTPSTTHYLDFWGTIIDVQWGNGARIQ